MGISITGPGPSDSWMRSGDVFGWDRRIRPCVEERYVAREAILAQVVVARARRQFRFLFSLLQFGETWSCLHAAQRLDSSSGRVGADRQKWPSAKANRQQPEQVLGRRAERPGRWRREPQLLVSPVSTVHVCRQRNPVQELPPRLQGCKLLCSHWDQRISSRKAALEASLQKAQVQATAPPVAEQVKQTTQFIEPAKRRLSSASEWVQWAQDWHSQCSKELAEAEERLVRFRTEEVQPMEEVVVSDWEAEAKALRQQIVELEGQRKSSVLSRVVASHPEQSSVEATQEVQERAAKRRACGEEIPSSPQLLSETH